MFAKMLTDHARMRELADRLEALLRLSEPCDMALLADIRWQLASTIMRHLAFEDRHLYCPMANHRDAAIAQTGRRFQDEQRGIFARYAEHAQHWTPDHVSRDWNGYRSAALAFLPILRRRMEIEELRLYPMAQESGIEVEATVLTENNWARDAFAIKAKVGKGMI